VAVDDRGASANTEYVASVVTSTIVMRLAKEVVFVFVVPLLLCCVFLLFTFLCFFRGHWKCHKLVCLGGEKKPKVDGPHEHDYQKAFPSGCRDNNEFDLICRICGHVA
jgi:hypothetical protein